MGGRSEVSDAGRRRKGEQLRTRGATVPDSCVCQRMASAAEFVAGHAYTSHRCPQFALEMILMGKYHRYLGSTDFINVHTKA